MFRSKAQVIPELRPEIAPTDRIKGHFSGKVNKLAILSAFLLAMATQPISAGPLDWLKFRKPKKEASVQINSNGGVVASSELSSHLAGLNQRELTGNNIDAYKFAQSHWAHSKKQLEAMCRRLAQVNQNATIKDIAKKLFVLDTQVFKESVKNSALATKEISQKNQELSRLISDIRRVITSPGNETLDHLEGLLTNLNRANSSQRASVEKYMVSASGMIKIGSQAYETLELIPSLSVPALDMFVQASKQLMKKVQSNGEAFKGLLLNVQSSNEQLTSNIATVKNILRNTLRFSDHFAIKQFPLVNLPVPSREKVFTHLKVLNNINRGISNTLNIGDSQARNATQQLSHLIQGLSSKGLEALKYQRAGAESDQSSKQISSYAQNQVSGLYLRMKETIQSLRTEMVAAQSSYINRGGPALKIESKAEFVARRASSGAQQQLPLFLLGGKKANSKKIAKNKIIKKADFAMPATENKGMVLYSEKSTVKAKTDDFLTAEVGILQQELGNGFFFDENNSPEAMPEDSTEVVMTDEEVYEDEELLPSEDKMKISYGNLSEPGPNIELLKFDSLSEEDPSSSDLLPMFKLDDEALLDEY
jgi:hypothetical protein